MCGRYEIINGQRVLVRFGATRSVQAHVQQASIWDNADVRPTQQVLVLRGIEHELSLMKWGLVPSWAKDPRVGVVRPRSWTGRLNKYDRSKRRVSTCANVASLPRSSKRRWCSRS